MISFVQNLRAERNSFACSVNGVTFPKARPLEVPADSKQGKESAQWLESQARTTLPHAFDMPMEPV